jgi:hypothetical protein
MHVCDHDTKTGQNSAAVETVASSTLALTRICDSTTTIKQVLVNHLVSPVQAVLAIAHLLPYFPDDLVSQ